MFWRFPGSCQGIEQSDRKKKKDEDKERENFGKVQKSAEKLPEAEEKSNGARAKERKQRMFETIDLRLEEVKSHSLGLDCWSL